MNYPKGIKMKTIIDFIKSPKIILISVIISLILLLFLLLDSLNAETWEEIYYPPQEELPALRQICLVHVQEKHPTTYNVGRFRGEVLLTVPCKDGTAYVLLTPR